MKTEIISAVGVGVLSVAVFSLGLAFGSVAPSHSQPSVEALQQKLVQECFIGGYWVGINRVSRDLSGTKNSDDTEQQIAKLMLNCHVDPSDLKGSEN